MLGGWSPGRARTQMARARAACQRKAPLLMALAALMVALAAPLALTGCGDDEGAALTATPASSATPAIVVFAGPALVCRRTAASVMRWRVSSTCSARRRMRYGRRLGERDCLLDIDTSDITVQYTPLFTVIGGSSG